MTLVNTALSIIDKLNSWALSHNAVGAFRIVTNFDYKGLPYVVKIDNDLPSDERGLGFCYSEYLTWERYKDTIHRDILCPILHYGQVNYRDVIDAGFSIMPRLKTIEGLAPLSDGSKFLRTVVLPNFRKRYPNAKYLDHRIELPNELFGNDIHSNNVGYDSESDNWQIIDYAGDDDSYDHRWQKLMDQENV